MKAPEDDVGTSPTPKKRKSTRGMAPRSGDGDAEHLRPQHEGDDSRGGDAVHEGQEDDAVGLVTLHSYKKAKTLEEEEEKEEEEEGALVKALTVSKLWSASGTEMVSGPNEQQRTSKEREGGSELEEREEGRREWRVVEIATKDELVKRRGRGLLVRRPLIGHRLAAFWHRDCPYVIDDSCPHRGAPLSEGDIEDLAGPGADDDDEEEEQDEGNGKGREQCGDGRVPHIVCPLHYYKFDMRSGLCLEGHDWSDPLGVYEAWVEGARVMARLPVLPPTLEDDDEGEDERDHGNGGV